MSRRDHGRDAEPAFDSAPGTNRPVWSWTRLRMGTVRVHNARGAGEEADMAHCLVVRGGARLLGLAGGLPVMAHRGIVGECRRHTS